MYALTWTIILKLYLKTRCQELQFLLLRLIGHTIKLKYINRILIMGLHWQVVYLVVITSTPPFQRPGPFTPVMTPPNPSSFVPNKSSSKANQGPIWCTLETEMFQYTSSVAAVPHVPQQQNPPQFNFPKRTKLPNTHRRHYLSPPRNPFVELPPLFPPHKLAYR